jgi:hypothetical protein
MLTPVRMNVTSIGLCLSFVIEPGCSSSLALRWTRFAFGLARLRHA